MGPRETSQLRQRSARCLAKCVLMPLAPAHHLAIIRCLLCGRLIAGGNSVVPLELPWWKWDLEEVLLRCIRANTGRNFDDGFSAYCTQVQAVLRGALCASHRSQSRFAQEAGTCATLFRKLTASSMPTASSFGLCTLGWRRTGRG